MLSNSSSNPVSASGRPDDAADGGLTGAPLLLSGAIGSSPIPERSRPDWEQGREAGVVAVLAPNGRQIQRIERALGPRATMVRISAWDSFERALVGAVCGIAVIEWLHADVGLRRLQLLRDRLPGKPIVLVTSRDADNARVLFGTGFQEVVWLSEIESRLWPAVQRACAAAVFQRAAQTLARALPSNPLLASALACACCAEPPFRSVSELAAALGCNRRTLWRHWRLGVGAGVMLRLEDVLDWLLLLHAVGHKSPGRSWSRVASELQVHPHTLARAAARLARRSLRALTAVNQLTLAREFDAQLLAPLLVLSSRDVLR
jgi:hypothetical protein